MKINKVREILSDMDEDMALDALIPFASNDSMNQEPYGCVEAPGLALDDGDFIGSTVSKSKMNLQNKIACLLMNRCDLKAVKGQLYVYNPDCHKYDTLADSDFDCFLTKTCPEFSGQFTIHLRKEIGAILVATPKLQVSAEDFNAEPDGMNCESGLLQYTEAGDYIIAESSPHNLYTYCVRAQIIQELFAQSHAKPTGLSIDEISTLAPAFFSFCQTSLESDSDKVRLLLEIVGYCLSDSNSAKSFFLLMGAPGCGKSVLASFLTRLLGEEVISNLPIQEFGKEFSRAALVGKKANIASDMSSNSLGDISFIKAITGSDRITAAYKGRDSFSFLCRAKLFFTGNTMPAIRENDATHSFYQRMVVLHFPKSIDKDLQNKNLLDELWSERNVIFTLAIIAFLELKQRNYQFTIPVSSDRFIRETERQDSIHSFISDCIVATSSESDFIRCDELRQRYSLYCSTNALPVKNITILKKALVGQLGAVEKRKRLGEVSASYVLINIAWLSNTSEVYQTEN